MLKKRVVLSFLFFIVVWLVVVFTEIKQLATTLIQGRWPFILAALGIQAVYYIVFTATYWSAFDTVEVKSRLWDLLPVTFGSLFLNVVTPAGGASGVALFVDDARRRGESSARATAGTLLQLVADFTAFSLILVTGLVYLFGQHDLQFYEIVAALILFMVIICLCGVLLLGLWKVTWLEKILDWFQ